MSFWKRLWGTREQNTEEQSPTGKGKTRQPTDIPERIEIEEDRLALDIFTHAIQLGDRALPCWTFVTDGLTDLEQRELVFTIPREAGGFERWVSDLCQLCATIANLAAQGKLVEEGGFTQFGPSGFPGQPRIRGLGYLPTFPTKGLDIEPEALTVIPLLDGEIEAFRGLRMWRMASRIGRYHCYYPYPPWWDLKRPAVGVNNPTGQSLLDSIPATIRAPGMTVTKEGDDIVIRGSKKARKRLSKYLTKAPESFALVPDVDDRCDGLMVWQPGQLEPAAISPEGSKGERLSVCALVLLREQESTEVKLIEDSAAALLTEENWRALEHALLSPGGRHLVAQGTHLRLWLEGDTAPS